MSSTIFRVTLVSCLAYYSTPKMETICSSETSVDSNGLHGVISQKMVLSITTAVTTSDPTRKIKQIKWERRKKENFNTLIYIYNSVPLLQLSSSEAVVRNLTSKPRNAYSTSRTRLCVSVTLRNVYSFILEIILSLYKTAERSGPSLSN
jgi:hypothetical protein